MAIPSEDLALGHDEAANNFVENSLLSFIVPAATQASLEEIFSGAAIGDAVGFLHSIPQRKSLFFDETLDVLLVLRTPWADEEILRSHLKRLVITLETQIVTKPDRGDGPVPHDFIFSGTIEDNDDPFIIVDQVDYESEGEKSTKDEKPAEDEKRTEGNTTAAAATAIIDSTKDKHVYAIWKLPVFLSRPRIRLIQPSALFSASASLKPLEVNSGSGSTLGAAQKGRTGYLQSGVASGMNLLASFAADDGIGEIKPRLSALRVSRVAPLTNPRELMRPLRTQTAVTFGIVPAVHTRVRFARPNTLPATPDLIASLEVDFTGMFSSAVDITTIDMIVQDGNVRCLSESVDGLQLPLSCSPRDHMTFFYRLSPSGSADVIRNPSRELEIAVRAKVKVSPTTNPELVMQWSTPIDFTIPVNPGFGPTSTPQPPIQRSHKPSQLSISGAGDGTSLISPSITRPDSLPAHETSAPQPITDLGITVTFAAPPGPVRKGEEFAWSVYVLNRSTEKLNPTPRKLALLAVPRRRRADMRIPRPLSMSRRADAAQIADAVLEENVVHSMQKNSLVDAPDVICLSADTRVGPLAPGACHVTELRFLALKEGVLGIEAVRVIDMASQEHCDIRELPLIVVKGENEPDEEPEEEEEECEYE